MENSFGRKIKNNFSLTFKKDEEDLKLWVNEQISPSAYLKKLILEDMKNRESSSTDTVPAVETSKSSDGFDMSDFDLDFED